MLHSTIISFGQGHGISIQESGSSSHHSQNGFQIHGSSGSGSQPGEQTWKVETGLSNQLESVTNRVHVVQGQVQGILFAKQK